MLILRKRKAKTSKSNLRLHFFNLILDKHCHRNTRDDHLKNLQDMILTDQKSADCGSHDNDEASDNGEETVALLGEWCPSQNHYHITAYLITLYNYGCFRTRECN